MTRIPGQVEADKAGSASIIHSAALIHRGCCPRGNWRRDCERHWRAWAYHRLQEVKATYLDPAWGYSWSVTLRLSYIPTAAAGRRLVALWWRRITRRYGLAVMVWVRHREGDTMHFHLLVLTGELVDRRWVISVWAVVVNDHAEAPYRPRDAWCQPCTSTSAWLAYMLGIHRDKPRDRPPWEGLDGRVCDGSRVRR
jgi:hypothetical protein